MRLYIISNRLPVKVALTADRQMVLSRSEGGLATGLNSLEISCEKRWIGWPGVCTDSEEEKRRIRLQLEAMNFHPVFLSEKQYENYYEGYSIVRYGLYAIISMHIRSTGKIIGHITKK